MATKEELRQLAKSKRKFADVTLSSKKIVSQILNWDKYKAAKNVMIYYPIKQEISLLGLPDDKNFFLPKVIDNEIEVCPFLKDSISAGKYGIPEPNNTPVDDLDMLDIVFIPALAADRWGYRIGYGCGYYDRFLPRLNKKTTKIIPVYSELLLDDIPIEYHDVNADFIVTEKEILSTSIRLAVN